MAAESVKFAVSGKVTAFGGIEQQIASIDGNQYDQVGKYLTTNVALWPRPYVLFANRHTFDRLSGQQQHVLRQAAANSITPSVENLRNMEAEGLGNLCRRGETLLTASATHLAALRQAAQPVYESLQRDPSTREFIAAISAHMQAVSPEPPPSCEPGGQPSGQAVAQSALDGVYTVSTKFGDYADPNPVPETPYTSSTTATSRPHRSTRTRAPGPTVPTSSGVTRWIGRTLTAAGLPLPTHRASRASSSPGNGACTATRSR